MKKTKLKRSKRDIIDRSPLTPSEKKLLDRMVRIREAQVRTGRADATID